MWGLVVEGKYPPLVWKRCDTKMWWMTCCVYCCKISRDEGVACIVLLWGLLWPTPDAEWYSKSFSMWDVLVVMLHALVFFSGNTLNWEWHVIWPPINLLTLTSIIYQYIYAFRVTAEGGAWLAKPSRIIILIHYLNSTFTSQRQAKCTVYTHKRSNWINLCAYTRRNTISGGC